MSDTERIRVEAFNLLVHYNKGKTKNLIHLLGEGLFRKLKDEHQGLRSRYGVSRSRNVKVENKEGKKIISGYFHKSSTLNWDFIDKNEYPKEEHGSQNVMPAARFYIDIINHRLFWITKVGNTHSPSPKNFVSFLKNLSIPILIEKYSASFDAELKEKYSNEGKTSREIKKNKKNYLKENNVTSKTFGIELVPLIPENMLEEFFSEKYKVTEILLRPKKANPTQQDFDDLLEQAEGTFDEAGADVEVKAKARDGDEGMNKDKIQKAVSSTLEKGTLLLKMRIKEKDEKSKGEVVVSNMKITGKDKDKHMDISLKKVYEAEFDKKDLFDYVKEISKKAREITDNLSLNTLSELLKKIK